MAVKEVLQVATTILAAVGGGGAIVLAFSSWLGKLWAERLMQDERHRHDRELAEMGSNLERRNGRDLEQIRAALDVSKGKLLDAHSEKVRLYQQVTDIIVDMAVDLTTALPAPDDVATANATQRIISFERARLRAYGYLGMFAPQEVMDDYDRVVEYLHGAMDDEYVFDFLAFRGHALRMLNAIRVDLGVDPSIIAYRGTRYDG